MRVRKDRNLRAESVIRLAPQPGPQTQFFATQADIAFYGGAAGGGKTWALLVEPLRHHDNARFGGVIFRRNTVQVRNKGGLWDESETTYPLFGGTSSESRLEWTFPSKMTMKFAHLEHEKSVLDWQGAQIPYIGFDEVTHFTEKQFFYMLSRNRSTSGVPGYVRATCNPDSDSWVRKLVDWWIGEDGYAIPSRSGKVRWFHRSDETLHWFDSKEAVHEKFGNGPEILPTSFTFISSSVYDNKILMKKDPTYLARLVSLSRVDRLRLLKGNWNVRATAGMFFRKDYFEIVDAIPGGQPVRICRAWDKAATKPTPENPDPDWTRGVKIGKLQDGRFIVLDSTGCQDTPLAVERLVKNTATQDGYHVQVSIAQDPGSAGVADKDNFTRLLAGFIVIVNKPSKNKILRAMPFSAQCENGNVLILRGDWNEAYLDELEGFDGENGHDDQVDASADAFNTLCTDVSIFDVL